jgi:hypothetical protein
MNTRIVTAAILLAGLAVSAKAQTWPGVEGDLIFGSREATATNDMVFDLGNANTFGIGAPLAAGTTLTWNLSTDLTAAFASDWKTAGKVSWSIVGGDASGNTSAPVDTVWAAGPNSTVLTRGTKGQQDTLITTIDGYNTTWGGVSTSATGGLLIARTDANSYSTAIGTSPNSFAYSAWGVSNIESDASKGISAELYELKYGSGNGIDLGTFNLNASTGVLTFTAFSAIPEPSTYAMILGVFALGFVMLRRRHQVTA